MIGWMDNVAVPTGAPDIENAKKFMNFLMDPENIALQQKYTGYQSAIISSNRLLPPGVGESPESTGGRQNHPRASLQGKSDSRLRQDLDGPPPISSLPGDVTGDAADIQWHPFSFLSET